MQLTETENLKLENIHLRAQMAQASLSRLEKEMQDAVEQIITGHGLDPTTHAIDLRAGQIVEHQPPEDVKNTEAEDE